MLIDLDTLFQEDMIEDIELDTILDESNEETTLDIVQEAASEENHVDLFNDTIY